MRVAQYIRVSSIDQNSKMQHSDLEQFIAAKGWKPTSVYQDKASGGKGSARPALDRLLADAKQGKFDCVIVWKLDRFGRSLRDCLNNIQTLEDAKVRFIAITQSIDTGTGDAAGKFLLHILGAAAEFERSLIRERVISGIRQARKEGKHLGRPRLIFDRDQVCKLHKQGLSVREICSKRESFHRHRVTHVGRLNEAQPGPWATEEGEGPGPVVLRNSVLSKFAAQHRIDFQIREFAGY